MTSKLFSDCEREDHSPRKHAEDTFTFLDRSARPEVAEVRRLLETWFSDYPTAERTSLKDHVKNDFHAGFLELFLHSYFRSNSFAIDPHPTVPGSTRKPDFLVRDGDCEFYLEATVARDKSDEDVARQHVKNLLLDAINSTNSPNFFLALRDFAVTPGKQPAARKIKVFLERELPKYDPEDVPKSIAASPPMDGPVLQFEDDTIVVRIMLVPRSPEARGRPDIRPIGIYPIETHWGGGDDALRESINDKATRYGVLDRPYLVCANYIGEWGADQEDILNALFGTLQFTSTMNQPNPIPSRKQDGVFIGPRGPRNTRVTGIIVANLFPWNLPSARFELYHNPWATLPLKSCTLPIRQALVVGDRLEWHDGVRLVDLYKLPASWPYQPAV